MKAIVVTEFGGPEVLKMEELPDRTPGSGEILVRLRAAGVNPVETYIRSGVYATLPELPYTPGAEGAGDVVAWGDAVPDELRGTRVFLSGSLTGTYAEYALCRPDQAHPLPEGADYEHGACLGIAAATAWRALFIRGGVRSGETVLVHGASGGVGSAAVQLATAAGVRVIGTAGSAEGLELVRASGAILAFHHGDPVYRQAILDATAGQGVDCIVEMLANVNLGEDLRLLGPHGRVVVVGSRGPVEINPRELMMREADVRGLISARATPAERTATFLALGRALADGSLRPVIARTFPLAQACDAHRAVLEGGSRGKLVLVP